MTLGQNSVYSERTMRKNIEEQAHLFSTLRRALVRDAANGFVLWVHEPENVRGSVDQRGSQGVFIGSVSLIPFLVTTEIVWKQLRRFINILNFATMVNPTPPKCDI